MLDFFPEPYSDELLYSILARYHIRSGNYYPRTTMKELFGNENTSATADLPCNIDELISRIPFHRKPDYNTLIDRYTLYPFYAAFLPPERLQPAYSVMRKPNGGNIHLRMGITTHPVKISSFMKFCPECFREDIVERGEYYWHRLHNTPGVAVCPVHNNLICSSSVNLDETDFHLFTAASPDNCRVNQHNRLSGAIPVNTFFSIAKDIQWLYKNFEKIRNSQDSENGFRLKYLYLLADKGFSERKFKRHFLNNFLYDLHEYYGSKLLSIMESDYTPDNPYSWAVKILRKHEKSFHPLRHLLLIRYLAGSPERFFGMNDLDLSGMEPAERHYKSSLSVGRENCRKQHERIDWQRRDNETLEKVKQAAETIRNNHEDMHRITLTLMGKRTGTLEWLIKHPADMPLTMSYIRKNAESIKEFQIRRINIIVSKLIVKGEYISVSKVGRLSGLNSASFANIKKVIEIAVESIKESYNNSEKIG